MDFPAVRNITAKAITLACLTAAALGLLPAASYSAENPEPSPPAAPTEALSPSGRVRANARQAAARPELRTGRWDPVALRPAAHKYDGEDRLAQEVLGLFRSDPELAEIPADLKVEALRGVVTLTGTVPSKADRKLAESKIRRLPGVKKVKNRLKVRSAPVPAGANAR